MRSHLPSDINTVVKPKQSVLSVRDTAAYALLGAIYFVAQVSLSFLPNIELVTVLLFATAIVIGARTFFPLYVFVVLEGLVYGFGLWWIMYLYVWAVPVIIVLLFRRAQSIMLITVSAGVFGLCFGALCAAPYIFIGGPAYALTWWISGIPYDILHCIGNVVTVLVLLKPLIKILKSVFPQKSGK